MYKLITLIILIIIIFYILNNFILKKYIKENYLTYFLPYYDTSKNSLTNFYKNNENNANYFKKKIDYNVINVGIIPNEISFITELLKIYLSKSNLVKAETHQSFDRIKTLDLLIENKINMCLSDYTTFLYYEENLKKNADKIRLVTRLYKLYIYVFTKKSSNIFNLNDFPENSKIGILDNPDSMYLYYNKLLSDIGYEENIDYKVIFYKKIEDLFKGLIRSECNIIIIRDTYPNNKIKSFLENNTSESIILLPFNINNEKVFFQKNSILSYEYVDLHKLSDSYLPKHFGKYNYNNNNSDIKLCYTYKIILSNIDTKSIYTYNFIKFYFENYKYLNNTLTDISSKLYPIQLSDKINILSYHKGVIDFLYEKGYITNIDNENCKYLIGIMECNNENLIKNNLINKF
jgi:TRAP-type uncharacterized transport system substrate-binding protein